MVSWSMDDKGKALGSSIDNNCKTLTKNMDNKYKALSKSMDIRTIHWIITIVGVWIINAKHWVRVCIVYAKH